MREIGQGRIPQACQLKDRAKGALLLYVPDINFSGQAELLACHVRCGTYARGSESGIRRSGIKEPELIHDREAS
jgi:hypothetical protein